MDKETLSGYGWIVIAVLVLSVMIALSTPFGNYVKDATLSTLNGLFDTEEKSLNVLGQTATSYDCLPCETDGLWDEIHNGTYYFKRQSDDVNNSNYYVWKSNNNSKNSSSAVSTFEINALANQYAFDWSVSSESGYDKLTIKLNGTTIVDAKSGTLNGTETVSLINGKNTLEVTYKKDNSTHRNDDCATITLKETTISAHKNINTNKIYNHNFNEGTVTKVETCTEIGNKLFVCTDCGYERNDTIECHEPEWDDGVITKEPNCTEDGEMLFTCTKCGNTKTELISGGCIDTDDDCICNRCNNQVYGLLDTNGLVLADWNKLVNIYNFNITANNNTKNLKYIINNNSELSSATKLIISNTVTSIGNKACYDTNLTSIIIPNSVKTIGTFAFASSNKLKSIIIPNGTTLIREYAFDGCDNAETLILSNTVKTIEEFAFRSCKKITSVIIPESVTNIERGIFSSCTNLTSIVVDKNNPVYDSRENCNAIIETATNETIMGCNTTVIPNSVTKLGENTFSGCTFKNFIIPDSITTIEGSAFSDCGNLKTVYIPSNVITTTYSSVIISQIFYGCRNGFTIYCEATEMPSGWKTNCLNSTTSGVEYSVQWGVTRAEYNEIIAQQ